MGNLRKKGALGKLIPAAIDAAKLLQVGEKQEETEHPLVQKYGIDPQNFGMKEMEDWAGKHNMEVLYNNTNPAITIEPKKTGGFLGFGAKPLATAEEQEDAQDLFRLAMGKTRYDAYGYGTGDSAYARMDAVANGLVNGASYGALDWGMRRAEPHGEKKETLDTLIPQEYQPYAYNGLKVAQDAHPKLYAKSNLAGRAISTALLRNATAGMMQGAFDGFRYAPYLEKLATQGLTLGARQGMLAATGQPTDQEWAESEEAKRALYEAYGQQYTPQELNIFDRARNIKSNVYAGAADGIGSTVTGDMIGIGMENALARYGMQSVPTGYGQQGIVGTTGTAMLDPRMTVYWDNNAIRYIAPENLSWYEPWMAAWNTWQGQAAAQGAPRSPAGLLQSEPQVSGANRPSAEKYADALAAAYRDDADRLQLQDGADSGIMKLPENSDEGIITIGRYDDLKPNVKNSFDKYNASGWKGNFSGQTQRTAAGSKWKNTKQQLPINTKNGDPITYREFDVNNRIPGMRRDAERFLYGSDGSVYYTSDHYRTFVKIN